MVKVYKSFQNDICLVGAVGATLGGAIDKRVNGSDVVGAGAPVPRVFRNLTKEDENGEAGSKFILFKFNTNSPVPKTMVRTPRRHNFESGMRMGMGMLNFLGVISDLS